MAVGLGISAVVLADVFHGVGWTNDLGGTFLPLR